MRRTDALDLINNADLTAREREILIEQELEKTKTLKEIAYEYSVELRQILRVKQKALQKLSKTY